MRVEAQALTAAPGQEQLLLTDLLLAGMREVMSFDRSIDRIKTIVRREP